MATMPLLQNFINGQFVPVTGTKTVDVINPTNEEVVAVQPVSVAKDVDAAYAAAAAAAKTWGRSTPSERQRVLLALADAIEANADELVESQFRNTGQPREAIRVEEVMTCANHVRFFAGAARALEGRAAGEYIDGYTSWIRREPIGVVGQIAPWNYPLMMAIWKLSPAIAAGNTVVLKPSKTTPESTLELARISQGIVPDGVLNVVIGDATTGELITHHPTAGLVSITGSVGAGKAVAAAAAETLARPHLELGGKAPAVVFEDVDIDAVAEDIAAFSFFNAGQDCTGITRVLVHESIYAEMVEALVKAAEATKTGDANDPDAYYGPLNNASHFANVRKFLADLPGHATIATGGNQIGDKGYYLEPTIVTGVNQDDAIVQQEVFGPVITVQPFSTEEEALDMANDVEFALASSVWTKDHARAMRFSRDLDFGCVWINTHILLTAEMPHGGFKSSGYGKDLSMYGLEDYTRIKHVLTNLA